jgi:hypothetical protein
MPQGFKDRSHQTWVFSRTFGLFVLLLAQTSFALNDSDKEAIRGLSNDAAADYNNGKFEAAHDKFSRAYALAKVPKLAVWVARSNAKLGRLVSAYEYYRQAVRLPRNELWVGEAQELAQKDAEKELALLLPRLPKVKIAVEGVEANSVEVRIDGTVVPAELLGVERYLDPGMCEFVATRGTTVLRQVVELPEGGVKNIVLRFEPGLLDTAKPTPNSTEQSSSSSTVVVATDRTKTARNSDLIHPSNAVATGQAQRTWGWVSIGVGVAGVLTGAVAGVIVAGKYSDLKSSCPGGTCDANESSDVESYRSMRTLSLTGFVVGGVGSALGLTLLLTSPRHADSSAKAAELGVWVTPESAGLRGSF